MMDYSGIHPPLDESAPFHLEAPASYISASEVERFTICNGCGSAKAKFDFVPDTIYGLKITEACYIHDWRYAFGTTEQDKKEADLEFLRNMLTLINRKGGPLKWLRRWRATTYYSAVCDKGHKAFWAGKQRN